MSQPTEGRLPVQGRFDGSRPGRVWLLPFVLVLALLPSCNGSGKLLALSLTAPGNPMPAPGQTVVFKVQAFGGTALTYQWMKDSVAIPGALSDTLTLNPVGYADAGAYWVKVADATTSLSTPPFPLEPVDTIQQISNGADSGPGSLRAALAQANTGSGRTGIQISSASAVPLVVHLLSDLPPVTGQVCILGPGQVKAGAPQLVVDGGGAHRPFFLDGGTLILDHFTVANGLGKGGDGPGGGGGAAGMGGALFINKGTAILRQMSFQGNIAQGGHSGPGGDGGNGGGGGFGGDAPATGGNGGPGGFLGGSGGQGVLDGSLEQAGNGSGDGAGGGAIRGGTLNTSLDQWLIDKAGGEGSWGGGGGFSVGPDGGGGQGSSFGGGGGGSGGSVPGTVLAGASLSYGGMFGGDAIAGDGVTAGSGGGGGGFGGAIFLREGDLILTGCSFTGNHAVPGNGSEPGLGKGGAIFVYRYESALAQPTYDLARLSGQTYSGNHASDAGLEDPSFDNDNFYVAQDFLVRGRDPGLELLLQRYRQSRKLGLPWTPGGR
jgi:hypothetical protein